MDYDYNANMQKIDEYIQVYSDYSDLEKLENRHIIDDYILKILEARYIKFYDLKTLLDVHNKILKLESLTGLIRFLDIISHLNERYRLEKLLIEDATYSVLFAYKMATLYLTEGLKYQLSVKNKLFAKYWDFNSEILNQEGRDYIKNIITDINYLNILYKKLGININIFTLFYKQLTTEQIAFIYAQLQFTDYDGYTFRTGENSTSHILCETIYQAMELRNKKEKIKFIEIIYQLGYCNVYMGLCAIIFQLLKEYDDEEIHSMLYISNPNISKDIYKVMPLCTKIRDFKDNDIKLGNELDTIYNYSRK